MTSSAAVMRHSLSWGEQRPDCPGCISGAAAAGSGAAARRSWKSLLALHGSPVSAEEGRSPARTAARSGTTYADFLPLRTPRRITGPPAPASDAYWQAAVAAALAAATGSALAALAARQALAQPAARRPPGGGAPPVDVGPSLRAKAQDDKSYKAFLDAVVDACQSQPAARLGVTRYAIEEERSLENPRWVTITLTVWFSSADITARMDAWTKMRRIVDGRTEPLRNGDDKLRMRDIDSRFFISMGSKYD